MNLYEIVHELVEHSTLGGSHKAFLHWHLDNVNPDATPDGPEPVEAATETPEQEIARLRAELASVKAEPVVSRETEPPDPVKNPFSGGA